MNSTFSRDTKDQKLSILSLSDYEQGRICVEIETMSATFGGFVRPINEEALNKTYEKALKALWEDTLVENMSVARFIDSLPLEPIPMCPSALKASPLLAKGQRRLEDLKAGITFKKAADKKRSVRTVSATEDGARPTLLERLRAKQLEQASRPPPPSKAELARKAALQRIDEVVGVLAVLSTSNSIGQQRISFTLPTVLGKLRDSFKMPISKSESEDCVTLLASEIAPEWVRIVKMGKLDALVVNRDERPSEDDIRERVKRAS